MARQTKQPAVLREIFAALGDDPGVIAECVARPALAERLTENVYAHDQRFHRELKQRAEAELQAHNAVNEMRQTSAKYTEVEWLEGAPAESQPSDLQAESAAISMSTAEWHANADKLASIFQTPASAKHVDTSRLPCRAGEIDNLTSHAAPAHSHTSAQVTVTIRQLEAGTIPEPTLGQRLTP
jgi:hypothetical protein